MIAFVSKKNTKKIIVMCLLALIICIYLEKKKDDTQNSMDVKSQSDNTVLMNHIPRPRLKKIIFHIRPKSI